MLAGYGQVPREVSDDHWVSDAGIEGFKQKENVRITQGKDAADELLDWDKTWLPPPIWEERAAMNSSWLPDYIRNDWLPSLKVVDIKFDMANEDFSLGRSTVDEAGELVKPVVHEDTLPGMLSRSFAKISEKARFRTLNQLTSP